MSLPPRTDSSATIPENSLRHQQNGGLSYSSCIREQTGPIPASPPVTIVRSQETHRLKELGTLSEHRQSVSWDCSDARRRMLSSPNLQSSGITLSTNYRITAKRAKQKDSYGKVSDSKRSSTSRPTSEQNIQRDSWSKVHSTGTRRKRLKTLRGDAAYLPSEPPSVKQPSACNSAGTSGKGGTSCLKSKVRRGSNVFSRLGWHRFSKRIFLQTTKLVDETTEELVKASRKFHKVPAELRELSLTMAVLDHSLIEYAQKVRKQPRRSQTEGTSNWITPINSWRHPGGLVSFSEILSRTLKSACIILQNMKHYSTFWGFLHVFKMIWILPVLFIFASVRLEAETYSMILTLKMVTVNLTKLILEFVRKELYPALPDSATITKLSFRVLLSVSTWIHKV